MIWVYFIGAAAAAGTGPAAAGGPGLDHAAVPEPGPAHPAGLAPSQSRGQDQDLKMAAYGNGHFWNKIFRDWRGSDD